MNKSDPNNFQPMNVVLPMQENIPSFSDEQPIVNNFKVELFEAGGFLQ
jgi:hypothetical protein